MVGHWKPLLGHPKHFFRKWLVSMIWSLKVGIVDGGYWGHPKIQDAGIRDPLDRVPSMAFAGDGFIHPEKVEESLENVRFVNQQDYDLIIFTITKGVCWNNHPLKNKLVGTSLVLNHPAETKRLGSSVRSGLRDIQSRAPQCREAPWRTQRKRKNRKIGMTYT